jgi:hypothetical protein
MNDGGLATAILIGMVLIVGAGLFFALVFSKMLARRFGWSGGKRSAATLALGALGVGAGVVAVIATFYESTFQPPPQVTFTAPPGFTHTWVFVLEDRASPNALVWTGADIPFVGKKTQIIVPPSGIVRVRDMTGLSGRVDTRVLWSDGATSTGQGGGPAPKSTGAVSYSGYNRITRGRDEGADPPAGNDEAFGAYIAARERQSN